MRAVSSSRCASLLLLLFNHGALGAAACTLPFTFTFANLSPYVPTLLDISCTSPGSCLPAQIIPAVLTLGIDITDPCVRATCVQSVDILAAINRGIPPPELCYVQSGPVANFCAYGHDVIMIDATIGAAMQATLAETNLQASDPRIRGNLARWLPEVYDFLQCTIPAGGANECTRGVCGSRTAVPFAHTLTTVPYGCHSAIDDPVLASYGHIGFPGGLITQYGRLVFSTDGITADGTFGYTRPKLNHDTTLFPRGVPYGILVANSYGVLTTTIVANGTNVCGSATGVCPWDDVRGLFLPLGTGCANAVASLVAGDFLSPTCMTVTCNGVGVCGTAINIDKICPLDEVTLGLGFEHASDGGGPAGRAALDPRCFTDVPRCIQRVTSGAGLPTPISSIYAPAVGWASKALLLSLDAILQTPQNQPLDLFQLEPYLPFSPSSTIGVLTAAVSASTATTGYALTAPAVCGFLSITDFAPQNTVCTRSLSPVPGPPDPLPATPACAVPLNPLGTIFAMVCNNVFASFPPSVSVDVDGVVLTPPLEGTPNFVRVAVCVAQAAPIGTYAVLAPNTPFSPPRPGAQVQCVISLCNGQGQAGMYAREPGSFCGSVTVPPLNYSPQCAELRCTEDATCILQFIAAGTSCVNSSLTCTTGETCDGTGYCLGGTNIADCVACVVDEDCVCTGFGTTVGWCRGGVCTAGALKPPYALPLARGVHFALSLPPLQAWQQEEFLSFASGQEANSNDHGFGYNFYFNTSAQAARACRVPLREQDMFAFTLGAPCYATAPAFGLCRLNGVCGPAAPLLRFRYNTTNETLANQLRLARRPCDDGSATPGSFSCFLEWAYQDVFSAVGTTYGIPSACGGTWTCTNMATNLSLPVLGTAPTVAQIEIQPAHSLVTCTPTPLELFVASSQVGSCSGVGSLTAGGWACGTDFTCLPPVLTGQSGCDPSRLFYLTLAEASVSLSNLGLFLPTPATYGPCIIPAQCDPSTGICVIGFAPNGAQCPGRCGGWPPGVCNGVGVCLRNGGGCLSNNTCLTPYCAPYARLDSGPFGILDVPVGQGGTCITVPAELFPGVTGGTTSSSIACNADQTSCTTGDTCNGAGVCIVGDTVQCPDAMNPCLITQGCSPTFGRCLAIQMPVGTPCATVGFCVVNGSCTANSTCQTTTLVCPSLSNLSPAQECTQAYGTCYGIVDFTLVPSSPVGAYETVTIPVGQPATLAVVGIIDSLDHVLPALVNLGTGGLVGLLASAVTGGNLVGTFDPALPAFSPPSAYAGVCVYAIKGNNAPCDLQPPASICGAGGFCTDGACVATAALNCTTGNTSFCQQSFGECIESMGGCVYPPVEVGTACGFFVGETCMGNFTCIESAPSGPLVCEGSDVGCLAPLAACQTFAQPATCTSGCTVVTAADGTNCSCLPQRPVCSGVCQGGACVLNGLLDPPPSITSMQDLIVSLGGSGSTTTTNGLPVLSKKGAMLVLGLVYAVVGLIVFCFGCLCLYDLCLLDRSVDEPMLIRQCCWFLCVGLILFLALMLFTVIYLNT